MSEKLIIRKLIEDLKKYGDHKNDCGITKVLNDPMAEISPDGHRIYPACNCGWATLAKSLRSEKDRQ